MLSGEEGEGAAGGGFREVAVVAKGEDSQGRMFPDPDLGDLDPAVDLEGSGGVPGVDDLNGEVGRRVDAKVDLFLASDAQGVGEVVGEVGLDAAFLATAPEGGGASADAGDAEFLGDDGNEAFEQVAAAFVCVAWGHEFEAPIEIDEAGVSAVALEAEHLAVAFPADIEQVDALVGIASRRGEALGFEGGGHGKGSGVSGLSAASAEEFLDGVHDAFLVADLGEGEVGEFLEGFLEFPVELSGAVGALHLAVAEEVALGEDLVLEQADALVVVLTPVVSVGEVEDVDVPVGGGVVGVDELVGEVVGGGDAGASGFPGVVEGMLIHLLGHGIMNDVAGGDAIILGFEPGVDPEGLDADDFFLLVGHGAGDVHEVEDDGVGLGEGDGVPGAVEFVLSDGDDAGVVAVVLIAGDLAFEGFFVGAFEVAEGFGAGLADAGVLVFFLDDVGAALGLDAGEFEALAEDFGEFVEGEFDLQNVVAGGVAGGAWLVAIGGAADGGSYVTGALSDASGVSGAVAELGDVDGRHGDGDQLAPGLADHFAMRNIFAEVRFDLASHDLFEAVGVPFDLSYHGQVLAVAV